MTCEHCKYKEAYLYDADGCEIFRIENLLYFRYTDQAGNEDEYCIEILSCPWCGSRLTRKLDAEGFSINVGDTVWDIQSKDTPLKVIRIESEYIFVQDSSVPSYKGIRMYRPYELTHKDNKLQHEHPQHKVYDADGVEINIGDTVWHRVDRWRGKVTSIEVDGNGYEYIETDNFSAGSKDLTHTEPDSLERIKKDRKLSDCDYLNKFGRLRDDDLLTRAIALLERNKDKEPI